MSKGIEQAGIELTGDAVAAYGAWVAAKRAEEVAKAAVSAAGAVLTSALGTSNVGTINGVPVVSVVHAEKATPDRDVLKRLAPKAYAKSLNVTSYSYLRKR
jgi:hypothetical protein